MCNGGFPKTPSTYFTALILAKMTKHVYISTVCLLSNVFTVLHIVFAYNLSKAVLANNHDPCATEI